MQPGDQRADPEQADEAAGRRERLDEEQDHGGGDQDVAAERLPWSDYPLASARVALDVGDRGPPRPGSRRGGRRRSRRRRRRRSSPGTRARRPSDFGDLEVGVAVARVRERQLLEEGRGRVVGVLRVDAEEGDLLAALRRQRLEEGELGAAGPAPRRPLVDDDRIAAQLLDPLLVRAAARRRGARSPRRRGRRAAAARRRAPCRSRSAADSGLPAPSPNRSRRRASAERERGDRRPRPRSGFERGRARRRSFPRSLCLQ